MVGVPASMRGSSAFKPSGSRRTNLIRLQPRGFGIFFPTLQARWRKREFLGVQPTFQSRRPLLALPASKIKLTNCIPPGAFCRI
jgi:hypothetical protein